MKGRIVSGVLLLVILVVSVVVHLPAAVVVKHMPYVRGLSIDGVQGTLWQGSANQITWQRQKLGAVNWHVEWSALLLGKAQVALTFGRGSDLQVRGKGIVGYDLKGLYAENVIASVPAKNLLTYSPMPLPITLDGQVDLTLKSLRYAAPWCEQGEGSIAWTQTHAGTPLGDLSMGPVIADLQCKDNAVTAKGQQQSEQVSSEFSAQLTPNQRYSAKAWFKPGAKFPTEMQKQLRWIGNPDNQGRYQFDQQGRL